MAETYSELRAEIAKWLWRDDLADVVPTFVAHAENRMNRELRLTLMERRRELATVPGGAFLALPNDRGDEVDKWDVFLEMRDLRLDAGRLVNLAFVAVDKLPEERRTGEPTMYSIVGGELALYPVPDKTYPLRLSYYAEIPPLSAKRGSNAMLQRAPDAYLFGSLTAATPFTRACVPGAEWEARYQNAVQALMHSDRKGKYTANPSVRPIRSI